MKSFVVVGLCIIAAVSVSAGKDEEHKKMFDECAKELGYSPDDMKAMFEKKDPKIGCVIACVMKKEGIMVNNEIKEDVALAKMKEKVGDKMPESKIKENIQKCTAAANKETEECNKAGAFVKCIMPPPPPKN